MGAKRVPRAGQAAGAILLSPLMMRSMASPPLGSVRFASIFKVNRMMVGCDMP